MAKALWEKRDELARAYDIAPGLLLSDDSIVEAASRKPRNAREFRMIRSLNERVRMRTGGEQDKMFGTVRADSAQGQAPRYGERRFGARWSCRRRNGR